MPEKNITMHDVNKYLAKKGKDVHLVAEMCITDENGTVRRSEKMPPMLAIVRSPAGLIAYLDEIKDYALSIVGVLKYAGHSELRIWAAGPEKLVTIPPIETLTIASTVIDVDKPHGPDCICGQLNAGVIPAGLAGLMGAINLNLAGKP